MKNINTLHFVRWSLKTTHSFTKIISIFVLFILLLPSHLMAEGSKEVYIGTNNTSFYFCSDNITHCNNGGDRSNFAIYDCDSLDRLNFVVNSTDEVVYLGFNGDPNSPWGQDLGIVYRIKSADGSIVLSEAFVPISGTGFINSIDEARAGPQQLIGSTGYDAIVFTPPAVGTYYIEFNRVENNSPSTSYPGGFELNLFDITVANTITSTAILGRVYSYAWQLYEHSYCSASFFIYSNDSIITSLSLNDMDGGIWLTYSNQTGCGNTGNWYQDRKSVPNEQVYAPQYKIFINEPDSNIFPPASIFGSFIPPILSQTYCDDGTVDFIVEVNKAGNVELELSFPPPYETRKISSIVNTGTNTIVWDGYDGATTNSLPIPNNTTVNYAASYISALCNYPLYDVEGNPNGFVIELVNPPGTTPLIYWDDSNLYGGTTNLTGCTSTPDPWSGCHTFPDGNYNTINTWSYTISQTTAPIIFIQERGSDSLIFVQQPPQYYSPGATNIPFSVVTDPNTDSYFWSYTGSDVTINHVNPSDNFITIDFGPSATSGDIEVYGTNTTCPNPGVTSSLEITIGPPPSVAADFSGTPTTGDAPLLVSFTDMSTGTVVSWLWGFGDGNTSTDQNPTNTYTSTGPFTVSLTVTDQTGSDTETKTDYVTVNAPIITPDFVGIPISGDAPLDVSFTDLSTGNNITWLWDFGDGITSPDQNPIHTYSNHGTYTVILTINDPYSSVSETKTDYITVTTPIISAEFDGIPTSGEIPLDVTFADLSTGNINSWLWDFGDGNTSTEQNPIHTYSDIGVYTVSLTISDSYSSDTEIKTDYITSTIPALLAEFEGDPTSGDVPLVVTFTDISVGNADTWLWDFGDGNTSTNQNPIHTYMDEGVYTVSLTISDPYSSDNMTKTDYITVAALIANFEGYPTSGYAPLVVTFSDLSTGEIDSWYWDFGDGNTSSFQFPVHTYNETGTYTVTLIITGAAGSDTVEKINFINTNAPTPIADFSGTPTYGEAPLLVNFSDLSTGEIDTWNWEFGDGDSSIDQNPSHEYLTPDNFTVSLTVTGPGGNTTEVKTDYILIPVGTGENTYEAIVVYPNPVSNNLHVIYPDSKNRKITVKNMEGKKILEYRSNKKEEIIDMQQFPKGIYSLIIVTDDEIASVIKFIKN